MKWKPLALALFGFLAAVGGAQAQNWVLDPAISEVSFGSIKKDNVGEVHRFDRIQGSVAPDGSVQIDLDLTSVNTKIDIRNSRLIEYLFSGFDVASIRTQIDMGRLAQMGIGEVEIFSVFGSLDFLGKSHDMQMDMVVARLSQHRVMASTRDMVFLNADDLGLSGGLEKLAELAKLPGITHAVPVTLRFVFNDDNSSGSAVAPVTTASVSLSSQGNAQRGLKVYMRCFSCHSVKEGRHSTGPSLHNIIGAPAGSQPGYQYSDALAGAGFAWTEAELASFLASPSGYIPGTSMAFEGLYSQDDIADLLSYLSSLGS